MAAKSCVDCVYFMTPDQARQRFKRSPGIPVCGRYGHALSVPGARDAENETIRVRFAEECPSYLLAGSPAAAGRMLEYASTLELRIAEPTVESMLRQSEIASNQLEPEKPETCIGCCWLVEAGAVKSELGWPHAICSAKGRLILSQDYQREAAGCEQSEVGETLDTTDGVMLRAEYQSGGYINVTAVNQHSVEADAKHRVDPREYVTDRPVTPEESAQHIRAWRNVGTNMLGTSVMLPIFDGKALCGYDPRDTYGGHKPHLYQDHMGLLYDLAAELMELDETPVLIGEAGTGKTEAFCWLAYLMDLPFYRFSIKRTTEVADLVGEMSLQAVAQPDGTNAVLTQFKPGRLIQPYSEIPSVICIDEPNVGPEEIQHFLRPIADNAKQLEVDGRVIKRHDWCFIGLAMNPSWNPLYPGTNPDNWADTERRSPIWLDLPGDAIERDIIKQHCLDDGYEISAELVDKIMQIAGDLRNLAREGTLPIFWGIRSQVKVARKTKYYPLEKAYRRAVIDGLEPSVVDTILASVRSVA